MKQILGPWKEEADKYYRDSLTVHGASYGFYKKNMEKYGSSVEEVKKYFDDLIIDFEGNHCILLSREYSKEELDKLKILL